MDIEALVLLEDDLDAQRLLVTWAKVGPRYDATAALGGDTAEVCAEWSAISGVDIDDLERLLPMLFGNDILLAGGMVDDTALRFVRSRLSGVLQHQAARR